MIKSPSYLFILFFTASLFFIQSCAVNPVTGKRELMLMSESQEIAMGKESDPDIISYFGLYEDDKLQDFIDQKGQAMAKISHRPGLDYHFRILDSPVVNAFAVPGGYVYFTRGILAHFNNEAEFSGVLGHEIGHITARHSAKEYSKQTLAQVGLMAGMIAAPQLAEYANIATQGLQMLFLKFSRDNESQSDKLGVIYSTKIGYNSHEMADFFSTINRLQVQSEVNVPSFQSTHPDPVDREKRVHELSTKEQQNINASNLEVNRDQYLKMIEGLVYGENPRQGYFENNMFYHPELKFQFPIPLTWEKQNTPSQVVMVSTDEKAVMVLRLAQGLSTKEAANNFVSNNQLKMVEQQNTTVNGLTATYVIAEQIDEKDAANSIRVLGYFIQYGDNIYNILGFAAIGDYDSYKAAFSNTMTKFKPLTDPSKLNVQPDRIHIKTVSNTTTLRDLLQQYNTAEDQLETLAILNGMELSEQVKAGSLIKVIGK